MTDVVFKNSIKNCYKWKQLKSRDKLDLPQIHRRKQQRPFFQNSKYKKRHLLKN
jgi:hypothetical protein